MTSPPTLDELTTDTSRDNVPSAPAKSVRKEAILEVGVFLLLIMPSMVLSFFVTPIVLHFLQDFTAIILLRYLQGAPSA